MAERVQRPHERLAVGHGQVGAPSTASRSSAILLAGHHGVDGGDADVAAVPRRRSSRPSSRSCARSRSARAGRRGPRRCPAARQRPRARRARRCRTGRVSACGRARTEVNEGTTRTNADAVRKFRRSANLHRVPGVPSALVTGVTGQDGSYLAELLLEPRLRGRAASIARGRARRSRTAVGRAAATSSTRPRCAPRCATSRPDELYHLAAPTFVPDSWEDPTETRGGDRRRRRRRCWPRRATVDPAMRVWVVDVERGLRRRGGEPADRAQPDAPADAVRGGEARRPRPRRRDARALRALRVLGASPTTTSRRAGPSSSCRARSRAARRRSSSACERELVLGDLDAVRDWSHAADVVRAAWLALQADEPGDYVIASGVGHTVRDLVAAAFAAVDLDWEAHVRVDPAFVRAPEPVAPVGDPSRARERLGLGARALLRGPRRRDGRGRPRGAAPLDCRARNGRPPREHRRARLQRGGARSRRSCAASPACPSATRSSSSTTARPTARRRPRGARVERGVRLIRRPRNAGKGAAVRDGHRGDQRGDRRHPGRRPRVRPQGPAHAARRRCSRAAPTSSTARACAAASPSARTSSGTTRATGSSRC